ncbi:hypothetical protein [Olleya sp. R77988]|uniref:hypothetical protein n=1 Tax=Olleya sp. R77988 TaxID=3093875 RepID=UPI0037C82562
MTDLDHLISSFSSDDQQLFIAFLEKKNKRKDAKNIALFKLISKQSLSAKDICSSLYGRQNKVAYHALRKRLFQSVIDFIATKNLAEESTTEMQLIKLLIAARACMTIKQYNAAYKILDKAEIVAKEHSLFSILNEIYHTKIQFSYAYSNSDLEQYISDYKNNKNNALLEDQLNIVYAKIRQTLNNINYKGAIINFETLINNTFKEHNISQDNAITFKALYQIMSIVSLSAFVTNDFYKIESFLLKQYALLKTHKNRNKQQFYHIQILYIIANTLFRNKKFDKALVYINQMFIQLNLNKKKHYNNFILKHNLLKGLILNYTNKQTEAIILLENSIKKKHTDIESLLDIHLGLIMIYIQFEDFKKAKQILSKLYHTDHYYETKAGKDWVIKKSLADIILNIELGNIDLVDSRLRSFKRSYNTYLKTINQQRVITYLSFVELYYKNPEQVTSTKYKNKIEDAFIWIEAQREDIFVMSFYAWLKSKMDNKPLYYTTLSLIETAKTVN